MDELKQAFLKVKQDIFSLGQEIQQIRLELLDFKTELKLISSFLNDLKLKFQEKNTFFKENNTIYQEKSTPKLQHIIQQITPKTPTKDTIPTDIPTDKLLSQVLKRQNIQVSIGNGGVPTNRQTDKQTDTNQILAQNLLEKQLKIQKKESKIDHLEKTKEILDGLDALKKEVRRKIKALTPQEMSVLASLYSLEEQGNNVDYPLLSSKLSLSESSIRDYIIKIQKKGLPITKEKLNNKRIILHISQDLKNLASLDTLLKLREI